MGDKQDWNPLNSTLGQLASGKRVTFEQGGGIDQGSKVGNMVREEQARQYGEAQQQLAGFQENESQKKAQEKKIMEDKSYLDAAASGEASRMEEDSFLKARNAARRAKGTAMFGGWNG